MLRWKPVENARRYQLQIARDDTFKDVVLDQTLDEPVFRWEELPNVTYYWRVRSFDAEQRPSQWSGARSIAAAAPAPAVKGPADGATLDCRFEGVDLAVEPQPIFKEYVLDLAEEPTFAAAQQQRNATGAFRVVLAPGRWHWRVRAVDLANRDTESTAARTLTVALAAPKARPTPDVGLGPRSATLAWDDVACATRYQVEATLESAAPVPLAASGTSASFKAQRAGEYRWRVAALDARGVAGPFSAPVSFRVRLPAPAARADVTSRDAELGWAAVPQAVAYRVEVAADSAFKPLVAQASVDGLAWKPELLPAGIYFWRVFARDASGHLSMPSDIRRWTVPDLAPPAEPEVLAPSPGLLERSPDGTLPVNWTAPEGAAGYDLQLDGGPIIGLAAPGHAFKNVPAGEHTLRLRARGPGGSASAWVGRAFIFGLPPVTRVTLVPAEVALGGPSVTLALRAFDADGRRVPGGRLEVRAERGEVGPARLEGGAFRFDYTPPRFATRAEQDHLVVTAGAHTERLTLPLRRGPFAVGLHAGARFNGGAVASPTFDLGVAYRPGWLSGRLTLELRGGVYAAGATVEVAPGESLTARTQLLPFSLLAAWTFRAVGLEWRLALGPAVQLAFVQVGADASFTALPSFEAAFGLGKALGPGVLEAQVGFLYGRLATQALLQAGGIGLALGYRLDLPGRGGP